MPNRFSQNTHQRILAALAELYPNPATELRFSTPFQLLVAVILSAQTTDRQVNAITARLFEKYAVPEDFAALTYGELEKDILSCGLYRHKAKNIVDTSKLLVRDFCSRVPEGFDQLLRLPGVGRKTANVVLANAFGQPALGVDTHVFRVANRLGLASASTPEKTEDQLKAVIPRHLWNDAHHWLIFHGRRVCTARRPGCADCTLREFCRWEQKE